MKRVESSKTKALAGRSSAADTSLELGVHILNAIAGGSRTVETLAKVSGSTRASTRVALASLIEAGFVREVGAGQFAIGDAVYQCADRVNHRLRKAA